LRRGGWAAVVAAPGRGLAVFDDGTAGPIRLPPRRRVGFVPRAGPDGGAASPGLRVELEPAAGHALRRFADVPAIAERLRPKRADEGLGVLSRVDGPHVARVVAPDDGGPRVLREVRVEIGAAATEFELVVEPSGRR
jgi:hypothetical protein